MTTADQVNDSQYDHSPMIRGPQPHHDAPEPRADTGHLTRAARAAIVFAVLAGCGDGRRQAPKHDLENQPTQPAVATAVIDAAAAPTDAAPMDAAPMDAAARVPLLPGSDSDERAALRRVGSVRVWEAVIERGDYLARRDRRGVVHGRIGPAIGPAIGPYHWLIDESRGSGSLTLRLAVDRVTEPAIDSTIAPVIAPAIAPAPTLAEGDRVVAWGAWHVDDERAWYWKAERLAALPDREWSLPVEERSAPGHVIVDIPKKPKGAVPVSDITYMGGTILFEVVRSSRDPADGWEISGATKWRPVARLHLPGERESYGGQDFRSPAEHWQLERDTRYVVKVKRFLPAKPGELANMYALDAPRRIVGSGGK